MSTEVTYAHGATGTIGVQGFAATAAIPTTYVQLAIKSWKATISWVNHNTNNTSVPGWTSSQKGKGTLKGTIEAQLKLNSAATAYDQTVNPIAASGPNLQADYCIFNLIGGLTVGGAAAGAVTATSNQSIFSGVAILTNFQIANQEGDVISYTADIESTGTVTVNGGS